MRTAARAACVLASALSLGACVSSPILAWRAGPDGRPAPAPVDTVRISTFDEAFTYLDRARGAYRDAIVDQLRAERLSTNALIGGGALLAALAFAGANRNVIAGTALAAGTGYAAGNLNLSRNRLLAHQAGVEALNCVERAATPLVVAKQGEQGIATSLTRLDTATADLAGALERAESASAAAGANGDATNLLLKRRMEIGREVLARTRRTAGDARRFLVAVARGPREVASAVDRIDAAVVRAVVSGTTDLSSVPGIVGGLVSMAGSFMPSASLDSIIPRFPAAATPGAGSKGASTNGLKSLNVPIDGSAPPESPSDALARATQAAVAADGAVAAALVPRARLNDQDAFKECGVDGTARPLAVSPSRLEFDVGVDARRFVDIEGGVKRYQVEIDGPAPDGLTVRPPTGFGGQAEVIVDGKKLKAPVSTAIRITDNAPTPNVTNVRIEVGPPQPGPTRPKNGK